MKNEENVLGLGSRKINKHKLLVLVRGVPLAYYVILLLLVPATLVAVYFFHESLKELFVLNFKNPKPSSFLLSNYYHEDFTHLMHNLRFYFAVILPIILLGYTAFRRFWLVLLAVFVAFPTFVNVLGYFILHFILLNTKLEKGYGFSKIDCELFGLLFALLLLRLEAKFKVDLYHIAMVFFVIPIFIVIFNYGGILDRTSSLAMATGASFLLVFHIWFSRTILKIDIRPLFKNRIVLLAVLILVTVYIQVLRTMILPENIIVPEIGMVGVHNHFLGVEFGIFIYFLARRLSRNLLSGSL